MIRPEAQNLNHKNRQKQVSAAQVNAKLEALLDRLLNSLSETPAPTPTRKRTVVCEGRPGQPLHCHFIYREGK